ncbi:uncharacterized protein F4822DRAFT_424032 [Hypoxylon trugodes]|uniref:uncharacterized protein n=1 Tax=Hypoxylon trugodes TaxID=326681 RepID=UPI00219D8CF4|nr:uncharacterized protein F4822DRAFT_424032 [Hypoxylon trugodes]KAI1393562.1 hypothetical protein F4822DRAFT_424032 [Hypoxylon trugodes]
MALGRWTFPTSRKQSSASSGGNRSNGTTTPTDNGSSELTKTPSRLMRTLTGGFKSHKPKKSIERDELAYLNRPFNQQNLEHQKILNAFEWNFGKRKSSHGGQSSMSGISPSASRNTSVDHGHTHPRFDSALVHKPPQEDPRERSEK